MSGTVHPYYAVALAPAIAALAGIGSVELWRGRAYWPARIVLAVTVLATSVWSAVLLGRDPSWLPGLRVIVGGPGRARRRGPAPAGGQSRRPSGPVPQGGRGRRRDRLAARRRAGDARPGRWRRRRSPTPARSPPPDPPPRRWAGPGAAAGTRRPGGAGGTGGRRHGRRKCLGRADRAAEVLRHQVVRHRLRRHPGREPGTRLGHQRDRPRRLERRGSLPHAGPVPGDGGPRRNRLLHLRRRHGRRRRGAATPRSPPGSRPTSRPRPWAAPPSTS